VSWTILKTAALTLTAAALVVMASWLTFFDQVNNIAYDFTQRVAGGHVPSSGVVIAAVDEESLDRIGRWPWPRDVLARLVEGVAAGAPAAIGLDVFMDDASDPAADQALADAIRRAGAVVLAARLDDASTPSWILPLESFREGARSLAHVHGDVDLDGLMRGIVTAKHAGGRVLPALSVETLRVAGQLPVRFEQEYQADLSGSVRFTPEVIRIRFSGDRGTFPQVPAWQILGGQVDAETFRGRVVLLGVTAEGLSDDWMTPFSESGLEMSGIEVHANAIESVYTGGIVRDVPVFAVLLALGGLFLGLRWCERRFEGWRFYLIALATVPVLFAASIVLMRSSLWLPFPTFVLGVGVLVPTLFVRKLVRVNQDLDGKISRLSVWDVEKSSDGAMESGVETGRAAAVRIDDPALAEQWLATVRRYESERADRAMRRDHLLGARRHNAPWKLDAVDFFSDQLVRFVAFNDAVLTGIEDVIVVSDPSGRIVYQNQSARRLDGFLDEPPALWTYLASLLDGRDRTTEVARVIAHGDTIRLESVACRGGRYYTTTLSPISGVGAVASLVDVTAQRALDQAKNDMVSLVSHELRTPLTAIRGYGDMLSRYDLVEARGHEFLASIIGESARLEELIQSFLDVASIESGRKQLDVSRFDAAAMLNDLCSGLRMVADAKSIRLETADPDAVADPAVIRADRVLLYQALSNLVSNAIKYSPAETVVTVELMRAGDRMVFRVRDQGYGIPSDEIDRVFEKFYRRSNDETRSEPGFGLGLTFVRQVAEQHGGGVELASEVGKGSIFGLWIPV
jgi:signal transduction histidine kinase/CHASE2 domain-containing sensor protein